MRNYLRLSLAAAALSASVVANAELIYGVSFDNQLLTFDSANPNNIISAFNISGRTGENVIGLDFRPATGQLFTILTDGRVGTLNLTNGTFTSNGTVSTQLNGTEFGVDFNPAVDRIRVISNTDQNLRVNPVNGATTVDPNVTLTGSTASPQISGLAYTNNFAGAGSTTLYGIEAQTNTLVSFADPNNGVATSIGALGFNASALNGFDISGTTGVAYASVQTTAGAGASLYTVNLGTGATTLVGTIGSGSTVTQLRGITVAPAPVPEPATIAGIGLGLAVLARRRRKNA